MTTFELKRWLKINGWEFEESDEYIQVGNWLIYKIGKNIFHFSNEEKINTLQYNLVLKFFEYIKTPLEEREEKCKYLLTINVANKKYYLLKNENKKDFHLVTTPYAYKTEFTQEEIDLLNFDLSKFIKEKVK